MNSINETLVKFKQGTIDKPTFIRNMYEEHHAALFDYAEYLPKTNVKKIEIEDGRVIMTSRDRGIRIACAPGDFRIAPIETLNFFDYEKDDSAMMENLIADGDNVFDVGANIGWYSINIAVSRRATKVYCFEPIPKTYAHLEDNLALNPVQNVAAHNFGFSNQAGEFSFYYYPEGSGNASAANVTGRTDVQTVQCKVRTLDDYAAETGIRVDFIKCDVEGAELLVFQGGIKTITRDKPVVFSEILRKWSAKFNYSPNSIFDLFSNLGYRSFTANSQGMAAFDQMDEQTVETNFFFLHTEKHRKLIQRYSLNG
ncbi:MAG: FkbM family methyltransferase [Sterolibacterium sp.]|jgi:FkbM family methyltransferase